MDTPTAYAHNIVNGVRPAGELVRLSCQRHMDDLQRSKEDPTCPWYWDSRAAVAIAEYARRYTNVQNFVEQKRVPFELLDWQAFFLGSIFGWKMRAGRRDVMDRLPDTRRFRNAVILTGRGTGKSPIGIVTAQFLMIESQSFAGVCLGAIDQQAWRPFTLFREMLGAELDPDGFIDSAFEVVGAQTAQGGVLRFKKDAAERWEDLKGYKGEFRSTSELARAEKRVGGLPSFVLVEEFQAHTSSATLNAFRTGFKAQPQPLVMFCMNAPPERLGPAWEMLEQNREGLQDGTLRDDTLHMEYAIDPGDLKTAITKDEDGFYPQKARNIWRKANPSIDYTVRGDYFASELEGLENKSTQDKQDALRELFSITPEDQVGDMWFEYHYWKAVQVKRRPEWVDRERDVKLYLGLDLGLVRAFTALGCCWVRSTGDAHVEVPMYTHRKDLLHRGTVCGMDFVKMAKQGVFFATPGEYCDLRYTVRDIMRLCESYKVEAIACDPFRVSQDFSKAAADEGLKWKWIKPVELLKGHGYRKLRAIKHPQGGNTDPEMSMRLALERVERRIIRKEPNITILANPLLEAMFGWAELYTRQGQGPLSTRPRWLRVEEQMEQKGKGFCDGLVALCMAVCIADYEPADGTLRGSFERVLALQRQHLGLDSAPAAN